ncbi:MAG TPA: hypothetical protein VKO20_08990, partial [Desulfosalsimonadaceae bacterium]|nr:hypothetical protein [Desulfosalsimonadaceae bacterium]
AETRASGWKRGVENLMEEFWRQMEGPPDDSRQEAEPPGGSGMRERPAEGEKPAERTGKKPPAAASDTGRPPSRTRQDWHGPFSGGEAPSKAASAGTGRTTPRRKESPAASPMTAAVKRGGALSRRELRNAVIWSEILARPVGLRDMED